MLHSVVCTASANSNSSTKTACDQKHTHSLPLPSARLGKCCPSQVTDGVTLLCKTTRSSLHSPISNSEG